MAAHPALMNVPSGGAMSTTMAQQTLRPQDMVVTDPEAAWRQLEQAYIAQGVTAEQWTAFQAQVEEGCKQQGIVRGQWAAAFLASLAADQAKAAQEPQMPPPPPPP